MVRLIKISIAVSSRSCDHAIEMMARAVTVFNIESFPVRAKVFKIFSSHASVAANDGGSAWALTFTLLSDWISSSLSRYWRSRGCSSNSVASPLAKYRNAWGSASQISLHDNLSTYNTYHETMLHFPNARKPDWLKGPFLFGQPKIRCSGLLTVFRFILGPT